MGEEFYKNSHLEVWIPNIYNISLRYKWHIFNKYTVWYILLITFRYLRNLKQQLRHVNKISIRYCIILLGQAWKWPSRILLCSTPSSWGPAFFHQIVYFFVPEYFCCGLWGLFDTACFFMISSVLISVVSFSTSSSKISRWFIGVSLDVSGGNCGPFEKF